VTSADISVEGRVEVRHSRGLWSDALRRLLRNGPGLVGLALIGLFVLAALLAPVIAPYDPIAGSLDDRLLGPSLQHLMGTDLQGRDEFSRILYGAQISLQVSVVAVLMGLAMGGTIGALAGAFGGRTDALLMG
jgi:ABC-type dipeptide/oligopeptide/nickel transport system permease subunit